MNTSFVDALSIWGTNYYSFYIESILSFGYFSLRVSTHIYKGRELINLMGTKRTYLQKMNWFSVRFEIAKQKGIDLDLDLTISEFCFACGCNLRTAKDLLKIFEMNKQIEIKDKIIKAI